MLQWPLILLLGCLLTAPARAADIAALEKKAKAGDAEAQYRVGEIYYEAREVKQDLPVAKRLIELAAAQGNAKAQYRMASMYFTGEGVKRDQARGRGLFQKSLPGLQALAKAGDADAQGKLGILYATGLTVERDPARALELFKKAATAGSSKAQLDLGDSYLFGKGMKKNRTLAGEWFEKAARAGSGPAQIQIGILCLQAQGRRQDIVGGMKWLETASKSGHPVHAKRAGTLLARLKKFPPTAAPDIDLVIKEAKAGNLKAQIQLGRRHAVGDGVRVDLTESARWLHHAARQGDGEACYQLGVYYILDAEIPRDAAQAGRLWRLAAWLGYGRAQVSFALMCAKGDGMPRDMNEAYRWMLIARRSKQLGNQVQALDRLQELIVQELDPDLIFAGLGAARNFQLPKTPAERKAIAAAAFGDGAGQLKRGQALSKSFPAEALIWMRLAETKKVKGAAEAAKAQAAVLAKKQLAEVERRVKAFKPLAKPR